MRDLWGILYGVLDDGWIGVSWDVFVMLAKEPVPPGSGINDDINNNERMYEVLQCG